MDGMDEFRIGRRAVLAGGAALVVHFAAGLQAAEAAAGMPRPALTPDQLDSFIAIGRDGHVVAYYGKMDPGQGVDVAIGQIVADELDVPMAKVRVVQGDTAQTVNQGGASGSTGIELGGRTLRYAAAEARRVLVERAATKLGVPAAELVTRDGAVLVAAQPARSVPYAALLDGAPFETKLDWNKQIGNELFSRGVAEPKSPKDYKIVGQSVPRTDLRQNVFGKQVYVSDIRLPGMLHARMIRPPVAGAEPLRVDAASLRDIPGARVVQEKALLAVVAEKEWNAIRAADALDVTWSTPSAAFPEYGQLHEHIRQAPVLKRDEAVKQGDAPAVLAASKHVVSAEYEWPFQSHSSMAGGCAVVDARPDGARVWSGTQKPHFAQLGVARMLGLKPEQVHVVWTRGPGSYGRNDAGDAVMDAAVLSRATGRPVRVQYTRAQGTGWDPKGPASVHRCSAALDENGRIAAFSYTSKGFSRVDTDTNESDPRDTLAGQLMGMGQKPTQGFGVPTEPYDIPARLLAWETIAPLLANASPLRTSHLRDPVGPQMNFASESFIDELAVAAEADPVEFRLRHLRDARAIAALKAASEAFGWAPRPAASEKANGDLMRGRGVALALRGHSLVVAMTEVEIDRHSFAVRPVRWAVAHDCGLIINPATLRRTIEGNIIHATSRALFEEVRFDPQKVLAVDWVSYPILDMRQTPDRIDIVLIDHPELPATGAGEASTRPVAAAIANAIFDATGTRLRQAPFTPQRLKASLA